MQQTELYNLPVFRAISLGLLLFSAVFLGCKRVLQSAECLYVFMQSEDDRQLKVDLLSQFCQFF